MPFPGLRLARNVSESEVRQSVKCLSTSALKTSVRVFQAEIQARESLAVNTAKNNEVTGQLDKR